MTEELSKANQIASDYLKEHIPKSSLNEKQDTVPTTNKTTNSSKNNSHINSLLNFAGFVNNDSSNTKKLTYSDELIAYLASEKTKSFKAFWNEHKNEWPILADFIRKLNIMTATSVPSESSFSIAGYAERKQRSRLSAKNLKYSMVVRDKDKLEKLIKKREMLNI